MVETPMASEFQSTPPRRGRRGYHDRPPGGLPVSIHAPAQGATFSSLTTRTFLGVSIHAPAQGATLETGAFNCLHEFQSTPPRRGRHNPTLVFPYYGRGFNPRPRAGGDEVVSYSFNVPSRFNPRPRAGGDGVDGGHRAGGEFQSTPPRRGRLVWDEYVRQTNLVSIHAPAQGATAGLLVFLTLKRSFQSTPPRRGRPRV